jgi:hypothetical protein
MKYHLVQVTINQLENLGSSYLQIAFRLQSHLSWLTGCRGLRVISDNMTSQHLTGLPTPQLDGYLKGIRDEFDRLNYELEETRKQRDEYITKCTPRLMNAICDEQRSLIQHFIDKSQANELRELRQTIARREDPHVCITDDNPSPLISRASSPSEYYSPLEWKKETLSLID